MTMQSPSVEERLVRYVVELDVAIEDHGRGPAMWPERRKADGGRPWNAPLIGLIATTLVVLGLGVLVAQRTTPDPSSPDTLTPVTSPPTSSPSTSSTSSTADPAPSAATGTGDIIEVPEATGGENRPPWDPIQIAPETIGWFEFGDGVPERLGEPRDEAVPDDMVRAGFFRCGSWEVAQTGVRCTELLGGNGVEHVAYGDELAIGVELGGVSILEQQLWAQARGSLWGYEEVTRPPVPTVISAGEFEGLSYRNGEHAYLAWTHASGAVVWLQSRGLSDEELVSVAANTRPAALPAELPVLLEIGRVGPASYGPGSNNDESSIKLGFLDGQGCVGFVMWERCYSTAAPAVFTSPDGDSVVATARADSNLSLDVDLGSAGERLPLESVGVGDLAMAVFDLDGRALKSARLTDDTGVSVAEVVGAEGGDGSRSGSEQEVGDQPGAPTLLSVEPAPEGFQLDRAVFDARTESGVAHYVSPSHSTELQVVVRGFPLPVDTLESLGRPNWEIQGREVWSDGELGGCLPDVCSIGMQWDERTSVSLMWVDREAGDLVAGSTLDSLLELVPRLIVDDGAWSTVGDDVEPATGPEVGTAGAVPIVPGDVLVANANRVGGSAGALTTRLDQVGFSLLPAANSTSTDEPETIIYVEPGAECLGIQLASALGVERITDMPDEPPVESGGTPNEMDVLVVLGNDIADRLGASDLDVDLGLPGELTVVDATDDAALVDAYLQDLAAAGVVVLDVVQGVEMTGAVTLHPIGATTPWTCGVAHAAGVGGFDEWTPDIIDTELPESTDAVLVIGI